MLAASRDLRKPAAPKAGSPKSLSIVQPRDQLLQFVDLAFGKVLLLGKVRDERRQLSIEQPVEEVAALGDEIALPLHARAIEIAAAVTPRRDRLLAQEAIE